MKDAVPSVRNEMPSLGEEGLVLRRNSNKLGRESLSGFWDMVPLAPMKLMNGWSGFWESIWERISRFEKRGMGVVAKRLMALRISLAIRA